LDVEIRTERIGAAPEQVVWIADQTFLLGSDIALNVVMPHNPGLAVCAFSAYSACMLVRVVTPW
jgi:hypothetical protein